MISVVTASITSLSSLWFQHLQRQYVLYCYSIYHVTMTLLLQHLIRHYTLYCYSIYNVPMIPTPTAYIMSTWSLSLHHLLCRYVSIITSIYYVFMIPIITTSITQQRSQLRQHPICRNVLWYIIGRTALSACYPMNNHLSLTTAHARRYLSYRGNPLDAQA